MHRYSGPIAGTMWHKKAPTERKKEEEEKPKEEKKQGRKAKAREAKAREAKGRGEEPPTESNIHAPE